MLLKGAVSIWILKSTMKGPLEGSSFITKYNGHVEKIDDLNTGTPSAFHNNEMFCWKSKIPELQ